MKNLLLYVYITMALFVSCEKSNDPTTFTAQMAGSHIWHGTTFYHIMGRPSGDTLYNVVDTFSITVINNSTIVYKNFPYDPLQYFNISQYVINTLHYLNKGHSDSLYFAGSIFDGMYSDGIIYTDTLIYNYKLNTLYCFHDNYCPTCGVMATTLVSP